MGATARLSDAAIRVDCGSEAPCTVTVCNTGTVVDEFTFTVLGEAAAWTTVVPPSLSLFPDAEGTATVTFRPPRDARTPQGILPFAVRVTSREDAQGSVVEEGQLDVGAFLDCSAEIVPRTSRGRRTAWHEVAVDNRGNAAVQVMLSGADPDEALGFHFTDSQVTSSPGTASFTRFRVSTRGLLWRGTPATIPFSVTVAPQGQQPIRLDASFQQQPMIPAWLPRTIAVVFALILASAIAWKVVLQPQVRKTVAQAPAVKKATQDIQTLANQTGVTLPSPGASASASPGTGGDAGGAFGKPINVPVNVKVGPGNALETTLVFPQRSKAALTVSGIIVQNPFNDAGIVTVQRHLAGAPSDEVDVLLRQSLFNTPTSSIVLTPPLVLAPGDTLLVRLRCVQPGSIPAANPGQPNDQCDVGVLLTGFVRGATAAPSPTPLPPP